VQLDQFLALGHGLAKEFLGLAVGILAIHQYFIDVIGKIIPNSSDNQTAVLINLSGTLDFCRTLLNASVHFKQVIEIFLQLFRGPTDSFGADDVADTFGDIHPSNNLFQLLAFAFLLNLAGNPGGVAARHDHHVTARQGDVAG